MNETIQKLVAPLLEEARRRRQERAALIAPLLEQARQLEERGRMMMKRDPRFQLLQEVAALRGQSPRP